MKVHVNIDQQGIKVNEVFEGNNAEEIVGKAKARVAQELNFAMRLALNAMSNLMFTQEVVRRYNDANHKNLAIPSSCEQFLELAQQEGFASVV